METAKLRRFPEFKREFFVAGTGGAKRTVLTSVGSEFERPDVRIASFVFVILSTDSSNVLMRIVELYLLGPNHILSYKLVITMLLAF